MHIFIYRHSINAYTHIHTDIKTCMYVYIYIYICYIFLWKEVEASGFRFKAVRSLGQLPTEAQVGALRLC